MKRHRVNSHRKVRTVGVLSLNGFFAVADKGVQRLRILYLEALYQIHLRIRYGHDLLYQRNDFYKKYTDNPLSSTVHKVTLTAFVASFVIFTFMQYIAPGIFNFATPGKVKASASAVLWTTDADFNNNAVSTNTATTKTTTALSGTVAVTNNQIAVVGTGTNFNTTVKNFSAPIAIRINGVSYGVATVADDTHLNLYTAYTGATASGVAIAYDNLMVNSNAATLHGGQVVVTKNATFTVPASVPSIHVEIKGGGGGGGSCYDNMGGNGGLSSLKIDANSPYVANGGQGGGDGPGFTPPGGAAGTTTPKELTGVTGGGSPGGAGGFGAGCDDGSGKSGGAGGRVFGDINVTQGQVITIVTGVGGTPSTNASFPNGAAGTAGSVIVTYNTFQYSSTGTLSGLKIDSGIGVKSKWSQLSWNTVQNALVPASSDIKFRVATSDDNSAWTWSGYYTQVSGSSFTQDISAVAPSRFLQIEATLDTSNPAVSPTLNDITVSYNALNVPANLTQYKSDGTTQISASWTNESQFVTKVDPGTPFANSSPITAQYEVRTADSGWTSAPSTPSGVTARATDLTYTCTADPCAALGNQNLGAISGLVEGTSYYYRIRTIDGSGRQSNWSTTSAVIRADQTSPVGTVIINSGAAYAAGSLVTLTVSATDAGGSSLSKMRFSNDGTTWSGWEDYTNSKSNWDLAALGGSSTDGTKKVHIQFKDSAGNQSGTWTQSSRADFDSSGSVKSGTQSTANGELRLEQQMTTATYTVATGQDDAVIDLCSSGFLQNDGTTMDVYVCDEFGGSRAGLLRLGINIPKNATIASAYLKMQNSAPGSNGNSLGISLMDFGNTPSFTSGYGSSYNTVGPSVTWDNGSATSNNIGSIVQNFVNRSDYNPNNYIGVYLSPYDFYGTNSFYTFENAAAPKPQLEVTYVGGSSFVATGNYLSISKDSTAAVSYGRILADVNTPGQSGVNALRFQVAANNDNSTWNFSGPDGTAGSYYSNGDQLWSGLNGNRYIKYRAYLQTADVVYTPTVYNISIEINTTISDTIILDNTPPANVVGLKLYTDSNKSTEVADSVWASAPNPYVEWTLNVADTAGYKYCFGAVSCVPNIDNGAGASVSLNLTNQSTYPDGTYYFRAVAYDGANNVSLVPAQFIYKLDRTIPGAVTGFNATQNQLDRIDLGWSEIYDPNGSQITYTIEKILYSKYLEGFSVTDIGPDKVWANQTAYGYTLFSGLTGSTYTDSLSAENQGLKFVYRIKASDETGKIGPYQVSPVYGLTRDGVSPTTPSGVVAAACSYQSPTNCSIPAEDALKGHEVKLSWSKGTDGGTGIEHYIIYRSSVYSLLEADYIQIASIAVPNPLPGGYNLTYTDSADISDYSFYYYRIVAEDGSTPPNKSILVPSSDENYASVRTPDVTAPTAPVVTASAAGLDNSNAKQKVVVTWGQSSDAGVGIKTYKLYRANQSDVTDQSGSLSDSDFTDITNNPDVQCDLAARICYEQNLEDFLYYYYRVTSVDNDPYNNVSNYSETSAVKTLSSAVPTPPKGRIDPETRAVEPYPFVITTKGVPLIDANVGHEAKVYFSGSYEKDCTGGVTTPCLVSYDIYRSADNSNWSKIGEVVPIRNDNDRDNEYIFTDNSLTSATTYSYQVRAIGNNTNISDGGVSSSGRGGIQNQGWDITPDITAPILPVGGLEVKVRDTHPNEFELRNIVTWKMLSAEQLPERNGVSDFSRYEVHREVVHPTSGAVISDTKVGNVTNLGDNYLVDIIPIAFADLKYKYYVVVADNAATDFKYSTGAIVNPFSNFSAREYWTESIIPSMAKPALTEAASLSNVGVSSAVVNWRTDQESDSLVQFRAKGTDNNWVAIGQIERSTNHSVSLFGLKPNTEYEYQLVSRNYLGNNVEYNLTTLPVLATTGFSIIAGDVVTTTSTTEINWTTNLDASSAFVEYQLQRQPGDEPQGGTAGVDPEVLAANPRNHTVVIKGLRSARAYTYKIKSISKDGYLSEYPAGEFANFKTKSYDTEQFTLAPSSSNVAERNITATTAQIVWQTENTTTSWVDYSTRAGIYDVSAGNNDLVNTHVVVIEGLVPGTTYYYRVRVKDSNEVEYTSKEYSFTAVLKPKISNMTVKNVTPYSVTISWDTNVDTETIVNWGKSIAYGEKRGKSGVSKVHELVIENLDDNQEYHYQILAQDELGTEVADSDKIVRTPLDTNGPQITNVKLDVLPMGENDTTSSVIVSWQTNKPASTLVEYDEGVIGGTYGIRSVLDSTLNNSHTVIIKDLVPASSYHYRLVSADKRDNTTVSQDYTFVTPTKEKSILQLILKSFEDTFAWTKNMNLFFGNIGKRLTGK